MGNVHRVPPLLLMAALLGVLFVFACLALVLGAGVMGVMGLWSLSQPPPDLGRWMFIALNLGTLSGACLFATNTFMARFYWPEGGPAPLGSWQRQVRAIVLVATLPSCALVLALVAPLIPLPQTSMFVALVPLSVLALLVERVAAARDRANRVAAARDRARRWIAQAQD